jgi:hypothetical protein
LTCPDLLLLIDPRLPSAEARSLAGLVETMVARGYSVALLAARSPLHASSRPFAPALRKLLDQRVLTLADPDGLIQCRLFVAWHIAPLLGELDRPFHVVAGQSVLRFDQLPWREDRLDQALVSRVRANFSRLTNAQPFEEVAADRHTADVLGSSETWLPPSHLVARWEKPLQPERPVIGRHGGLGNAAWPSDAAAFRRAYPAGASLQVNLLDPPVGLLSQRIVGPSPRLRLIPASVEPLDAFLGRLDSWHLASWKGRPLPVTAEVVEAAAYGVPLSLPRELNGWPEEAASFHAGDFREIRPDRETTAVRALDHVRTEATPDVLAGRLEARGLRHSTAVGGLPRGIRKSRRTVLMISPNGIGMGHLTRQLAVARRLPGHVDPIFLTMSQALAVVEKYGFHAEYLPYHAYYGGDPDYWNRGLLARLLAMIGFYDPQCILFDGNMPYAALADLRRAIPERRFLWLRRALWRPDAGKVAMERSSLFDMVFEPGEYAAEADRGLTRSQANGIVRVAPVTLLDPDEVLSREDARLELGIAPDATAVVVLLGSQNNFDYGPVRRTIAAQLGRRPNVVLIEAEWLISEANAAVLLPRARPLSGFPLARLFRAFDFAVSAAGYNSFHELIAIGVPTIFVPNENPSMDEQEARAAWAERHGLGVAVRSHETDRLVWALASMQEPGVAERMHQNILHLPKADGAGEIARLIAEQVACRDVLANSGALPYFRPRSAPLLA